jgi:gliding motility-associated-like protein
VKRNITAILIFCTSLSGYAQIVNGGFENYSSLPVNMGQWQVVQGWGNAGSLVASPDFYHYAANVAADIPETPLAMVDSYDGDAMMGFIACGRTNSNLREYLSTEFVTPLTAGKKYKLKFQITNGDKTLSSLSGLGVDKLGCYLSVNPVVQIDQTPLNVTPQLKIEEVLYNEQWQTLSFTFFADQPFKYLTMGLFGDDSDKQIEIRDGADPMFAYYFVDDFSVEPISLTQGSNDQSKDPIETVEQPPVKRPVVQSEDIFFVPNSFTPNNDANNDTFKAVSSTIKEWKFEILTRWGDRVFVTEDENLGWDGTYNGQNCENGTYVWQITYLNIEDAKRPREVMLQGSVIVLR